MKVYVYPIRRERLRRSSTAIATMRRRWWPQTTIVERFLLLATSSIVPLQSDLPKFRGMSMAFIIFAISTGYILLGRLGILVRTLRHPVFLAGFAFVGIGLVMEFLHDSAGFFYIWRIVLMLLGAVLVAALCRDRQATLWSMYGLLGGSLVLAGLLCLKTYGIVSMAKVETAQDADRLRIAMIQSDQLQANLNAMAYSTAQGAVVALALALTATTSRRRYVFSAIAAVCVFATFLPMSRTGLVVLAVSCVAVAYARGIARPRVIIAALILTVGVLVWIPKGMFSRFTVLTETKTSQHDSRVRVYSAVIKRFPEYGLAGVGISHFWGDWGRHTEFAKDSGEVSGAHNCFAQVTIYWGLGGLLAFLIFVWQAYRCLPKRCGVDPLRLSLLGLAIPAFVLTLFSHGLEAKEFSLALGILASAPLWLWPYHTAQMAFQERSSSSWRSKSEALLGRVCRRIHWRSSGPPFLAFPSASLLYADFVPSVAGASLGNIRHSRNLFHEI